MKTVQIILAVLIGVCFFQAKCQEQDDPVRNSCLALDYIGPNQCPCKWYAQQIVRSSSDGSSCRGVFVSKVEKTMIRKRREAIEAIDSIDVYSSSSAESFFSYNFEEETTSENFLKTVDELGESIAGKADFASLYFQAEAGISSSTNKKRSVNRISKRNQNYFSSIKGANVPIKSIVLDPFYIRLNQPVLQKLAEIEKKLNITIEDKNVEFNDFFNNFGSHILWGTLDFGGTIIIKAETYSESTSVLEDVKEAVMKSADAYFKASASGYGMSGGASLNTNANSLNDKQLKKYDSNTLSKIKLSMEKKGGPPGVDEITKWKQSLDGRSDTWKVIKKPTNFLAIWELLKMHHQHLFVNAENLASLMEEEWKNITKSDFEEDVRKLGKRLSSLGTYSDSRYEREDILLDMVSKKEVRVEKDSKYGRLYTYSIPGGADLLLMSSLQKEHLNSNTTYLQFDTVMHIPVMPYKVYLKLHHNNVYLGLIVLALSGYSNYPRSAQQILDLSTGDNPAGVTYTGSGFTAGLFRQGQPGEHVQCQGYKDANGQEQTKSLYEVEGTARHTTQIQGEIRVGGGTQWSGFWIVTQFGSPQLGVRTM